ncbi:unnamed protein product [Closterium sp. NIES-65]|nr:unnamed protein product [Closterium sp. NIES-65]
MAFLKNAIPLARRALSSAAGSAQPRKVAVLGAGGGIGQPLSLLMKSSPLVTDLSLYDVAGTHGVAADISHICSNAKAKGYLGSDELAGALEGSDLVLIPAGVPRKPGMTRQDLFNINAGIVKGLCEAISKHCPTAAVGMIINPVNSTVPIAAEVFAKAGTATRHTITAAVGMISNPVNSTVPIAAEVFAKAGTYDPKKLFGITTLDIVRARTFYAEAKGLNAEDVRVPVVGGHAGATIIPLFSQATPFVELSDEERDQLTKRTQDGGTEVVQAKAGKGSATLSMAYAAAVFADSLLKAMNGAPNVVDYAAAVFADSLLKAMNGAPNVVECTYVESKLTEARFFASKVRLGPSGAEEILPLGDLIPYEEKAIHRALPELQESIQAGVDFVKNV